MNSFEQLGFTDMDGFMLSSCVFFGLIGASLDYILKRDDLINLPAEEPVKMTPRRFLPLMFARVFLGMAAGGVIWILLSEGLVQSKANFLRLILLSIAAGFCAPSISARYRDKIDSFVIGGVEKTP